MQVGAELLVQNDKECVIVACESEGLLRKIFVSGGSEMIHLSALGSFSCL